MTLDVQVLVIAFLAISLSLAVEKTALEAVRTKDSADSNGPQPQPRTQRSDCQNGSAAPHDSGNPLSDTT
jgi:hypothetical protein